MRGFGLFTASWVAVGVARSVPLAPAHPPPPPRTPALPPPPPPLPSPEPLHQDRTPLVNVFFLLSACFEEWSDELIFTHVFGNFVFFPTTINKAKITAIYNVKVVNIQFTIKKTNNGHVTLSRDRFLTNWNNNYTY